MPKDATLPPRLELLWLTVRLAHANHLGATEEQMKAARIDMARFRKLVSDLYEEDAPLACWATLHLAVQATDAFDFARARRLVRDFLSTGVAKQERLPFGHPEGLYEAFANMYRNFTQALLKKVNGEPLTAEDLDFPDVNDGIRGVKFIAACLKSNKEGAVWTEL